MRVTLTGATGLIGRQLVAALLERGDEVTVLTRDPERARRTLPGVDAVEWEDPKRLAAPHEALSGRDAVVNLLGENVAQRWTEGARQEIRDSRIHGTRNLVEGLRAADPRPRVLLSQSGTDFYGPRGDERVDESTPPVDGGFLQSVTFGWEEQARGAEELGMRVVLNRTGVVLAEEGGALGKMLPFFKAGVGGPVAGGRQYVAWVHRDDVVGAMLFALDDDRVSGPLNLSAPEPVTNGELSKTLGRVLRRPAIAPVPALALKALYGQMSEIVVNGVRMVPARLQELGYEFRRPDLEDALRDATS